jgi:hypothetical protein
LPDDVPDDEYGNALIAWDNYRPLEVISPIYPVTPTLALEGAADVLHKFF